MVSAGSLSIVSAIVCSELRSSVSSSRARAARCGQRRQLDVGLVRHGPPRSPRGSRAAVHALVGRPRQTIVREWPVALGDSLMSRTEPAQRSRSCGSGEVPVRGRESLTWLMILIRPRGDRALWSGTRAPRTGAPGKRLAERQARAQRARRRTRDWQPACRSERHRGIAPAIRSHGIVPRRRGGPGAARARRQCVGRIARRRERERLDLDEPAGGARAARRRRGARGPAVPGLPGARARCRGDAA